jgi:hypothetical protein
MHALLLDPNAISRKYDVFKQGKGSVPHLADLANDFPRGCTAYESLRQLAEALPFDFIKRSNAFASRAHCTNPWQINSLISLMVHAFSTQPTSVPHAMPLWMQMIRRTPNKH